MTDCDIILSGDTMKDEKLFVWRNDRLYLHHTLTKNPDFEDFAFKSHSHNMVEIYYFLQGNAKFVVEGNVYSLKKGSLVIMAGGQTHHLMLEGSTPYERIALLIDTGAIPAEYNDISDNIYANNNFFILSEKEQIWFTESFSLITKAHEEMRDKTILSFISMIFTLIFTKMGRTAQNIHIENSGIKQVVNYINKNLTEELSLDSISKAMFTNKAVLNRKFKEIMGCTIWEYVIRRRIFSAQQRLYFSGDVTEAFEKSGFNDYSCFYRSYKRLIGMSPSEDLKKRYTLLN